MMNSTAHRRRHRQKLCAQGSQAALQGGALTCSTVGRSAVSRSPTSSPSNLAVDESSVILLQPPLPLVGVSIVMERERQQNDSLVRGWANPSRRSSALAASRSTRFSGSQVRSLISRRQPSCTCPHV